MSRVEEVGCLFDIRRGKSRVTVFEGRPDMTQVSSDLSSTETAVSTVTTVMKSEIKS